MTAKTPPKGRPTPSKTLTRSVPPTILRTFSDLGHLAPSSKHARGREVTWKGTGRIVDPPARQRANRHSWQRLQAARRG